jgi:hypothetical protein
MISFVPIPVAARSKAWVCVRSLVGIVGSNSAGGMDVSPLLSVVFRYVEALRWDDHLPRGVLSNMVCLSVIVKPR